MHKGRVRLPNQMNFVPRGWGVIFNPKIHVTDFGNFKQGFLTVKLIQNSNFRVQGIFFQQLYHITVVLHLYLVLNTDRLTLPHVELSLGGECLRCLTILHFNCDVHIYENAVND